MAVGETRLKTIGSVLIRITQVSALHGLLAFVAALLFYDFHSPESPDAACINMAMLLSFATPAVERQYFALSRNCEFTVDLIAAQLDGDAVSLPAHLAT